MKYIVLFLIVLTLMGLPVYMFEAKVMPELLGLQRVYGQADEYSQSLVAQQ